MQPPIVKTNSIAAASEPVFDDAVGEVGAETSDIDAPHEEALNLDPTLTEARRILADYVSIINKEPIISKAP